MSNYPSDWKVLPVNRGHRLLASILRILGDSKPGHICGGFARWLASPNPNPVPYGDIDIYCRSLQGFDDVRAKLLSYGLEIDHESEIALTFKPHGFGWLQSQQTLQLIKPVSGEKIITYGSLREVLEDFDFSVVRAGVISETEILVDPCFEQDERSKVLRLQKSSCPLGQLIRIGKYHKRGYYVPDSVYLQVLQEWASLSEELRNQIISAANLPHLKTMTVIAVGDNPATKNQSDCIAIGDGQPARYAATVEDETPKYQGKVKTDDYGYRSYHSTLKSTPPPIKVVDDEYSYYRSGRK